MLLARSGDDRSQIAHGLLEKNTKGSDPCRGRENTVTDHRIGAKTPIDVINQSSTRKLECERKNQNIDNAKWLAKRLIINLEILAALDKADPLYEVYKKAALRRPQLVKSITSRKWRL
jgi:hypothetical protein